MKLFLKAPAKLNLVLKIGPRRSDGYHSIFSLFQTISLADELTISLSSSDEVVSSFPLPQEENLAYKALKKLRMRASFPPVKIELKKSIPPGSGLGGASSDAAAVLKGVKSLFALKINQEELKEISLEIGSDVPYFLAGGTCLVKGRGELVEKLPDFPSWPALLFLPNFSISTSEAYQWWDEYLSFKQGEFPQDCDSLDYTSLKWGENDFERVVFPLFPVLERAKRIAIESGVDFAGLSGSGSAVYALSQKIDKLRNLRKVWKKLPGTVKEAFFENRSNGGALRCRSR